MAKGFKLLESNSVSKTATDFGVEDSRGRKIGYSIRIVANVWREATEDDIFPNVENPAFIAYTSATRDGERFGASTSAIRGNTRSEVGSAAVARMVTARRRYMKKFG